MPIKEKNYWLDTVTAPPAQAPRDLPDDNDNVDVIRQIAWCLRRRRSYGVKPVVLFLDRHDERLEVQEILALLHSIKNAAGNRSILKNGRRELERKHFELRSQPLLYNGLSRAKRPLVLRVE